MGVTYEGNYYQGINSIEEATVGDSLDDYNWVHPNDIWMFIRKGGLEGELNAYQVGWYPPYGPFSASDEEEGIEGSGDDHRFDYFAPAEVFAEERRTDLASQAWNVLLFVSSHVGIEPYGKVMGETRRRTAVRGEHPLDTKHRISLADSHPHKDHPHNQDCECDGP